MWFRFALVIGLFASLPVARAQFLPGSLMSQTCPYPMQMAPSLFNPNDAKDRLQKLQDKRDRETVNLDKQIDALNKQIDRDSAGLYGRLWGVTASVIIEHVRNRNDGGGIEVSCIGGGGAPVPVPIPGSAPTSGAPRIRMI